jgi:hypothetical protein
MSGVLQNFLAESAQKTAGDLKEALHRIPADKRNWAPAETSRSALDQLAECAILNGQAVEMLHSRQWPTDFDMDDYMREKAELARDENAAIALLDENTAKVCEAIRALPDEDLNLEIQMPWKPMKLSEIHSGT